MQLLHAGTGNMRIDLCGRQIAVPQQHLHNAQISAVIEQMGREGVPQRMRRHLAGDLSHFRITLDDVPERLASHAVTTTRGEQIVGLTFEQNLGTGGRQ